MASKSYVIYKNSCLKKVFSMLIKNEIKLCDRLQSLTYISIVAAHIADFYEMV